MLGAVLGLGEPEEYDPGNKQKCEAAVHDGEPPPLQQPPGGHHMLALAIAGLVQQPGRPSPGIISEAPVSLGGLGR